MAIGETTVTVVGNISSEVFMKDTHSGSVAGFWLRSNERRYDKESGEWCNGRSLAVRVSCWRRLAENVRDSLSKGDPVVVSGRLYTTEFVTDGQSRTVTELEAQAVGPNLSWCTSGVQRNPRGRNRPDPGHGVGETAEPAMATASAA
ncbi:MULTISPECIES: single-stranded DNA-binding protein [Prauserella salsuginis group]|uniref:Single-stranded DNA-binding protein n=2 Tax=Prauserella salsuginis group TaxID=2893672 RepID=A0A839XLZ1_9PSEU|nr:MULTISPECIES: single-stranded DNA-binding protein [Prauserella salsuginis group]MBB3664280.1 single-strand DNA-binding protein [Prauserella sediminis]MCR3721724.1 single-strand DNA-binding protein [Prauserella flava]MCR3734416.1 single-strand DNA-binding protein [Prauserella salsuginis]